MERAGLLPPQGLKLGTPCRLDEAILASSRRDGDQSDFYARLYAGLYFESMVRGLLLLTVLQAHGLFHSFNYSANYMIALVCCLQNVGLFRDNTAAKKELLAACATPYAQQSDDYYAAVARLHVNQRASDNVHGQESWLQNGLARQQPFFYLRDLLAMKEWHI
eukprot:172272-Pelagomonas_calceolata.AAC.1